MFWQKKKQKNEIIKDGIKVELTENGFCVWAINENGTRGHWLIDGSMMLDSNGEGYDVAINTNSDRAIHMEYSEYSTEGMAKYKIRRAP